jgi:hypothetical protein
MADTTDDARNRKLQALFDQMPTHVSLVYGYTEDPPSIEDECEKGARPKRVTAVFAFSVKGMGFGELTFVTDQDGQTYLDTEHTSLATVKEMLGWLVDHAIIDHETDPEKHRKYNEVRGATCGEHCRICNPPEGTET